MANPYYQPTYLQTAAQSIDNLSAQLLGMRERGLDRQLQQQQLDQQATNDLLRIGQGNRQLDQADRQLLELEVQGSHARGMDKQRFDVDTRIREGELANNTLRARSGAALDSSAVRQNDARTNQINAQTQQSVAEHADKMRTAHSQYRKEIGDELRQMMARFGNDRERMLADPMVRQRLMQIAAADPSMMGLASAAGDNLGAKVRLRETQDGGVVVFSGEKGEIETPARASFGDLLDAYAAPGADTVSDYLQENAGQQVALRQMNSAPVPATAGAQPQREPALGMMVLNAIASSGTAGAALVERLAPGYAQRQQATQPQQPADTGEARRQQEAQTVALGQAAAERRGERLGADAGQKLEMTDATSPAGVAANREARGENRRALSSQSLVDAVDSAVDDVSGGDNFEEGFFLNNRYEYFGSLAGSTDPSSIKQAVAQTVRNLAYNNQTVSQRLAEGLRFRSTNPDEWTRNEWAQMTNFVLEHYKDNPVRWRIDPRRALGGEGDPGNMGSGRITVTHANKYLKR